MRHLVATANIIFGETTYKTLNQEPDGMTISGSEINADSYGYAQTGVVECC